MHTIKIKDMGVFSDFLKSIISISQCQEFIIGPEGCRVGTVNELSSLRAYIETDNITCDTEVRIALKETFMLSKAVSKFYELNGRDLKDQEMTFNGKVLHYNSNGYKIDFFTVSSKVIAKYLTEEVNFDKTKDFGVKIDRKMFKNILSTAQIVASEGTKVYFYKEDNQIIVDIDDKSIEANSISLPISDDFYGEWQKPLQCKLDVFRMFNVVGSETIDVSATVGRVMLVEAETENVNMEIITGITKQ